MEIISFRQFSIKINVIQHQNVGPRISKLQCPAQLDRVILVADWSGPWEIIGKITVTTSLEPLNGVAVH